MQETHIETDNTGCEDRNEKEHARFDSIPGQQSDQPTSKGSIPTDCLIESRKQNIHRLQAILNDLNDQYEGLKNLDDGDSTRRAVVLLREIRLHTKLIDLLIANQLNPKNLTADDELLTEEGGNVFKECVRAFLLSANRFIRQELFAGDPEKAQAALDRLAAVFDESFGIFINTYTEEEN